jgi:phosphoadenosine phosphosulfate reductase
MRRISRDTISGDSHMDAYEKKVARAIRLLKSIPQDGEIEVSYSGGKDSDVILELAKMSGIPFRAIYKNTTIDPPGTIKHCREKGVEIFQPKKSFMQIIEKKGMPTRRARFCCSELKEYKVLDRAIQGIRKTESKAREERYKEPEICRVYNKHDKVRIYLPILDWTDEDVERFIKEREIKCHPLYYDEQGNFHVERRLGCIGCPMQSDSGKKEFKQYPQLLKRVVHSVQTFLETHPNSSSQNKFQGDACNLVFHNLFCESYDDYVMETSTDLFGNKLDTKTFLEEYFNIKF